MLRQLACALAPAPGPGQTPAPAPAAALGLHIFAWARARAAWSMAKGVQKATTVQQKQQPSTAAGRLRTVVGGKGGWGSQWVAGGSGTGSAHKRKHKMPP